MEVDMHPEADNQDLRVTRYCDHDHPAVRERAGILASSGQNATDVALATFLWVRDQIPFGLDLVRVKASETLHKGYGACFNKSLLLVALLRANAMPARFFSVPVSRWFMKPYIGTQCLMLNNPFHHCLVQLQLEGRWSWAELTLDRATYEALFLPLGVGWGIEWSPQRQDRLYLESIVGEPEYHHDLDQAIEGNVGNTILPAPLARALCSHTNRKAWGKIGIKVPRP